MPILKLTDICKDYMQGKEPVRVLKNVNMTVEKGDYLAIMGPSGSGKTTLMNIIGCLDVPTSGSYELDGKNLKDLTDDDLAEIRNKHLGFVFQSFHLLPKMDALDNVALPLLYAGVPVQERRERAAEALKSVGLEERMHFLPNQMSGGQCQRVAIARAIVGKPDLLLADEPTGALDTKAGNQIMDIFRQLSQEGMTIIMITHEPSIAACADKTYRILDGELHTGEVQQEGDTDEETGSEEHKSEETLCEERESAEDHIQHSPGIGIKTSQKTVCIWLYASYLPGQRKVNIGYHFSASVMDSFCDLRNPSCPEKSGLFMGSLGRSSLLIYVTNFFAVADFQLQISGSGIKVFS